MTRYLEDEGHVIVSLPNVAAGGGLIAADICEAIKSAKTTAGTHIRRKN